MMEAASDATQRPNQAVAPAASNSDSNKRVRFTQLESPAASSPTEAARLAGLLKTLANVLGLLESDPEVYLKGGASEDENAEIEALIQQRLDARANKNWEEADRTRDQLHEMGVELEDKGGETIWRRK